MINGAGKQAIKNGGLPVTNSFPEKGSRSLRAPPQARWEVPRKSLHVPWAASAGSVKAKNTARLGLPGKKMNVEDRGGYGGNRTLTLSRHNPCHCGRRGFRSSPGCQAERGGAPVPWLRGE
jgi:hypothetical protein